MTKPFDIPTWVVEITQGPIPSCKGSDLATSGRIILPMDKLPTGYQFQVLALNPCTLKQNSILFGLSRFFMYQ